MGIVKSNTQAKTYQQQAYNYVKAQIMNLELKPGQYITDSEIAEALEISRTPVREGLRRLEQENFLINEARRGWKVYTLSLEDIHEIFDIKQALEGMLARRAAECQDMELREQLQTALEQMEEAVAGNDPDGWLTADIALHQAVFAMAANARAQAIVQTLNDQWHRVRIGFVALKGRIQRSCGEHQAFVERILAGDGDAAEREMREHLDKVREELEHLLVNLVLPFVEEGV